MSRKIILYISTSIDGYIADKNGSVNWLNDIEIKEEDQSYEDFYKNIDTVVLGRKTYNQIINELAPNNYPYEDSISYIMTNKTEANTPNKIFTNENIIDLIKRLKKGRGKDIWIVGGSSTIMPLIEKNMIDEYQLAIIPILLGDGISLFQKISSKINLKTQNSYMKNGIIFTTYTKN